MCKILALKPEVERTDTFGHVGACGWILLKWVLKLYDIMAELNSSCL